MKNRLFSGLALAAGMAFGCESFAATKTVCSNLNLLGEGYLIVATDIIMSGCPNGKGTEWSTPSDGLVILKPTQLVNFKPPYAVTKIDKPLGAVGKYTIRPVVDGLVACASPVIRPYQFFAKANGKVSGCAETGPTTGNSVKYYQHMWVEIARPAGKPGELRVKLNSNFTGPTRYYSVVTTVNLHGGTSQVIKTPITASKNFRLADLGSGLLDQAKQGATFTFKVEAFENGSASVARYTVKATGKEMIKN